MSGNKCDCSQYTNIRDRCCPISDKKLFKTCPYRVSTAYDNMNYDNELCETLYLTKSTKKQKEKVIVSYLHNQLKIISRSYKDEIIKYFWEQNEELLSDTRYTDKEEEPSQTG